LIDLHSHILPGLDDGAHDVAQAVEMARSMAADGVRLVAATPHVRVDYPTTPDAMAAALALVRDAVKEAAIPIDVRGGGEIGLEQLERLDLDTIARFGLGGNPRLVLLEYPYYGHAVSLAGACRRLRAESIVPIVAHPERNRTLQARPEDIGDVVASGGLIQLTAAAVDGGLGARIARCARRLLELELAHLIATDAHAPNVRGAGLTAARATLDPELGEWLTLKVPEALLAGKELPPRPHVPRRGVGRRRWRWSSIPPLV